MSTYPLNSLASCVVASLVISPRMDAWDRTFDVVDLAQEAEVVGPAVSHDIIDAEVGRLLSLYTSNDSPCWRCHEGAGDHVGIVFDDSSGQYVHERHDPVDYDEVVR